MTRAISLCVLMVLTQVSAGRVALGEDAEFHSAIARIKGVGREGVGNESASRASRELAGRDAKALVPILAAIDESQPIAANWLRAAVDTIAARTLAAGLPLPQSDLEKFLRDRTRAGTARRLAYEWLIKVDPTTPDRLLPQMLDDPGLELRRDAVIRALAHAEQLRENDELEAKLAFKELLDSARDYDQVMDIAKRLESLGEKPNLTRQFGCVQSWHLIAPFDNTSKAGFGREFAPELEVDLQAEYPGKAEPIRWSTHITSDPFGIVDLNKVIGKHMGATAYGIAQVDSPANQPVSIRVGSPNAIKVWLNGKLLCSRDEYHHGMSMDQYQSSGMLKSGRNTILIKICQNEQQEDWAQDWKFQLRVCDPTGRGIGQHIQEKK